MSKASDTRTLVQKYEALGWKILRTRKGHQRWVSPNGPVIIHSGTPSDTRAYKNHVARLKRCAQPGVSRYK